MLACVVIDRRHLRQSPQSRFIRAVPLPASPLEPSTSNFQPPALQRSNLQTFHPSNPPSPLAATLMDLPASVANKRLTVWLSPLDATFTKNKGEGAVGTDLPPYRSTFNCRLSTSSA